MFYVAIKMLMGERGKYFAMIIGVFCSALIITQQLAIFFGVVERFSSFLLDTPLPQIWVMDPKVQFLDDIKPLPDMMLYRVRGVEGVDWAAPLYKGLVRVRLPNGTFQSSVLVGIDDASLIGGPAVMTKGELADLHTADSVLVDQVGANTKLALPAPEPGGAARPLAIGDTLEINDRRAQVVGIAKTSRTFQTIPVIYTTYSRATKYALQERKLLSFILVQAMPGIDEAALAGRISAITGLAAYTAQSFKWINAWYFIESSGIAINFGIAVLLAVTIGAAVVGQTFYSFTAGNLRYFGTLKAIGASNKLLFQMLALQAALVGLIGYGLGVGAAAATNVLTKYTDLAFKFHWQILLISASGVVVVCVASAYFSVRKTLKLEPAIVFRS
jgi:putative ABC transport system permease protein